MGWKNPWERLCVVERGVDGLGIGEAEAERRGEAVAVVDAWLVGEGRVGERVVRLVPGSSASSATGKGMGTSLAHHGGEWGVGCGVGAGQGWGN